MKKKKLTLESAAKEWIELKAQRAVIEKRTDELKEFLEPQLRDAEGKSLELAGWKFSLVEFEKESFSLSKAREKIDGRILAPYVSTSQVIQIRTHWKGGEEAIAA